MARKSFYFYENWASMLFLLPDDILASVTRAIMAHAIGEDVQNLDAVANAIVQPIIAKMDEDEQAYANKCERNRNAAATRWTHTNECERIQTNANAYERMRMDTDKDKDRDKEKDKEKEKDKGKKDYIERILCEWNSIPNRMRIPKVTEIKPETTRYKMLCCRIDEYGMDKVMEAIDNVARSSFLKGNNNHGWACTLEWFSKPNNFIKVLEGYYNDAVPFERNTNSALEDFLKGGNE